MASPAETLVPFAVTVRAAREERGLTQEQAARQADVTLNTWQNWEAGKHEPRLGEFRRVCMIFGWRLPFLGDSDTPGYRIYFPHLPHPVGNAA